MIDIEPFGIVKYTNLDDLPDAPYPYYVAGEKGLYVHKNTTLGPCILPEDKWPKDVFESMGDFEDGYFRFTAPRIPATIVSQALDFFRIVFDRIKAEAEVLILFKEDTKEFDLFIPYQVVSHGSVDSIHDQADIPADWTVVGTIHSHCDFDAFHSGIDEGDARNFNGVHMTIGHIDTDNPSFAAMVMINEYKFTFKLAENVAEIEGDLDLLAAPEAWYENFVFTTPNEILKMDFKTLTQEQVKEFGRRAGPAFVVVNNQANKDWRDNWRDDVYNGYQHYNTTRYSMELKASYPEEYFEGVGYSKTDFKPDMFEKALTQKLEELFTIAEKYGIYLQYDLINLSAMEDKIIKQ